LRATNAVLVSDMDQVKRDPTGSRAADGLVYGEDPAVPPAIPSGDPITWVISALKRAINDARVEADVAYEAWRADESDLHYLAYRAAQERADAVASDLAALTRTAAAPAGRST
jgi:hypothetical protein